MSLINFKSFDCQRIFSINMRSLYQRILFLFEGFDEDALGTPSHDSSFGDDSQEQDPLALEPKVKVYNLFKYELIIVDN